MVGTIGNKTPGKPESPIQTAFFGGPFLFVLPILALYGDASAPHVHLREPEERGES